MNIEKEILKALHDHPLSGRNEISSYLKEVPSESTMKRLLAASIEKGLIISQGKGRSTKYALSPQACLTLPIDVDSYFKDDIDKRKIQEQFNFDLIPNILPNARLFTEEEFERLDKAQKLFKQNSENMSGTEYHKEMERLGIDLSWKSAQIEGNTYSLLETEYLLKEKIKAVGKSKEEAAMLLNHKDALDFILEKPDCLKELSIRKIEEIHSILVKDLNVDKNIRRRRIGITGTNYKPLDNEFQIREALEGSCYLINERKNIHEKALLTLILLSYIQAFSDGNKRTARIISNAILIAYGYCPISFRTVESIDYKKAMLIFYEQNNIEPFKKIFIEQFEFAAKTYF